MSTDATGTAPAPWTFAAPWGGRGYVTDLDGPVHWIEFESDRPAGSELPPMVLVHGLGGSHLNWALIGPHLARSRRVVALDLAGFGLTPGTGRDTAVRANVALLDRFLREVVGAPAVLVGNSMGGMITMLTASGAPELVRGAVLVDPAVPAPRQRPDGRVAGQFLLYAVPGVGERYLRRGQRRLSAEQQVRSVIDLCFADPARADADLVAAGVALADLRRSWSGTEGWFLRAARTLLAIQARPSAFAAMVARIQAPVLLVHGERDRLVPVAAARRLAERHPGWTTAVLPDVGHTPQLESPDQVIAAIDGWLAGHPDLSGPVPAESG